jgi:hypothetical protein
LESLLLQALILKPNGNDDEWRQRELLIVVAAKDGGEESCRPRCWLLWATDDDDNAKNDVWTVWSDQACDVIVVIIAAAAAMRVIHGERRAEVGGELIIFCFTAPE